MPVTPDAVSHLQAAGHDAIHASSVGLAQATDPEIIEIARRDGRVVVTADLDYPRLVSLSDPAGPGIRALAVAPGNGQWSRQGFGKTIIDEPKVIGPR